jgi:hypothetical protein
MATEYGAYQESRTSNSPSATTNYGAYLESRQGSPSALASYEPKKSKPRTKASDTSKMNSLYKPKASPGPISSAANVRENRLAGKATVPTDESYSRKNMGTRPVAESTRSGKKVIERKSWRQKRGD